jgi:hypothetical protein
MEYLEECNRQLFSICFLSMSKHHHINSELSFFVILLMKLCIHDICKYYSEHKFSIIHHHHISERFSLPRISVRLMITPSRTPSPPVPAITTVLTAIPLFSIQLSCSGPDAERPISESFGCDRVITAIVFRNVCGLAVFGWHLRCAL